MKIYRTDKKQKKNCNRSLIILESWQNWLQHITAPPAWLFFSVCVCNHLGFTFIFPFVSGRMFGFRLLCTFITQAIWSPAGRRDFSLRIGSSFLLTEGTLKAHRFKGNGWGFMFQFFFREAIIHHLLNLWSDWKRGYVACKLQYEYCSDLTWFM